MRSSCVKVSISAIFHFVSFVITSLLERVHTQRNMLLDLFGQMNECFSIVPYDHCESPGNAMFFASLSVQARLLKTFMSVNHASPRLNTPYVKKQHFHYSTCGSLLDSCSFVFDAG